jgi:hypothetical protein
MSWGVDSMHRFLTAFLCLSTLVMTQNVVAGTPTPFVSHEARGIAQGRDLSSGLTGLERSRDRIGGEVPSPGTMMLLVTGLAGLSAVGSRRGRVKRPIRS